MLACYVRFMDVIFTHETALDLYRLGFVGTGLQGRETVALLNRLRSGRASIGGGRRFRSLGARGWRDLRAILIGAESTSAFLHWWMPSLKFGRSCTVEACRGELLRKDPPLHLLVPSAGSRHNTEGVIDHVFSGQLPRGSIRKIDTGLWDEPCHPNVYVTSPELTFLIHAGTRCPSADTPDTRSIDDGRLDLLSVGFELCSYYLKRPDSLLKTADELRLFIPANRQGIHQIERPLTTPAAIANYLDRIEGRPRGIAIARRAASRLAAGAASPMEAIVTLLLCLPRRLGGYGLPLPELNGHLVLSDRARILAGQGNEFIDLFWRSKRVALEYDSDAHHVVGVGPREILTDKHRANAANDMNVRPISLTKDQLYSPTAFDAIARSIRSHLGIWLKPDTDEMRHRRMELRLALLGPRAI